MACDLLWKNILNYFPFFRYLCSGQQNINIKIFQLQIHSVSTCYQWSTHNIKYCKHHLCSICKHELGGLNDDSKVIDMKNYLTFRNLELGKSWKTKYLRFLILQIWTWEPLECSWKDILRRRHRARIFSPHLSN